jgi:2-dehydropantoate 2-reductase
LRAVCLDTLAEARRLGVTVPRLEAAEPSFADEEKARMSGSAPSANWRSNSAN